MHPHHWQLQPSLWQLLGALITRKGNTHDHVIQMKRSRLQGEIFTQSVLDFLEVKTHL
jgi:hypothetical protein